MTNTQNKKPQYTCRHHPTEGFHEVGCPDQEWTKEQLQEALDTQKVSNQMALEYVAAERAKVPEELKEKIKMLIVEECNIARSENQPTSRLTSLYNKVSELK